MEENMMTIKKVKIKSDGNKQCISIDYQLRRGDFIDDLTGLFREEAVPEFYATFEALREHVEGLLEIAGKGLGSRILPYGVTFHYSKDGTMGAIISSKFELPDSGTSIVLNTPMRKCVNDESAEGIFLTEEAAKALWKVEQETRKYIAGKRAQMSLFGDNGEVLDAEAEERDDDAEEAEAAKIGSPIKAVKAGHGAVIVDSDADEATAG